jgi:ADP-heptose:LPS heptosyltransferase
MGQPRALVSAARGIGDILRITPLIRVFARSGYQVDVLLAPDYLETIKLIDGAPEVRKVFYVPGPMCSEKGERLGGLELEDYDVAAFTLWSASLQSMVRARRVLAFQQHQWIKEGDMSCVEELARAVGWEVPLPPPFALASDKRFGLPASTVALHPGCKPDWPWKKWHGFRELARLTPEVAMIGTAADLQDEGTYFQQPSEWPEHVRDFVGKLALLETAALIRECAALVSNDSGIMHLGVAVGTPTFGIFGLTSPAREAIRADNMIPITKGLACEPACRQIPWGRRDCEYHLECLKTLSPQEVYERLAEALPRHSSERA